jgi:hypothetical protein
VELNRMVEPAHTLIDPFNADGIDVNVALWLKAIIKFKKRQKVKRCFMLLLFK